ncbi:MAE_28990/MAE_18760 family HEPN-like nuclease [Providencia vermicola]|uniref:MAE_28990/MAE_18760 family HEPN-like nuclease n=1 Tax=Providencia vermicola TaxID=333965 RepID=UPI00220D3206|nr:MAE_28990/MAE_18760 family HEPN-like nuclease [Providencia stuartii]
MKIRSRLELEEALDQDLFWRKHEIASINGQILGARKSVRTTLIRAAITLMYAHWEGHVKKAAEVYLTYLNHLAPKYSRMKPNFCHISLHEKFESGFSIKKYLSQKEIFDYISSGLECNFKVNCQKIVDTESNLKSDVFLNLMHQLGLETKNFELKKIFIDQKLVKNRNAIAHGERVSEQELEEAYREISSDLFDMIQTVHNMIKNAASNDEYLK